MPDVPVEAAEFEGAAVVGMEYEVRGISGGLSDPAKFNPVYFHRGDEGYLVLRFVHRAPRFDPVSKEDLAGDCTRVQILDVLEGTIVDEAVVLEAIQRQRDINEAGRKAEEEAKGILSLDLGAGGGASDGMDEDDAFVFARNHAAGTHEQPMPGCPVCIKEGRIDADGNLPGSGDETAPEPEGEAPEGTTPIKGRGRGSKAASAE